MQDDRSRLAVELDAALARSRALDRVAEEVAARVDRAGAAVRDILAEMAEMAEMADMADLDPARAPGAG